MIQQWKNTLLNALLNTQRLVKHLVMEKYANELFLMSRG